MDRSRAPVLQALRDYHDPGYVPFNPPGHKQGRGVDPRVLEVMGEAVFRSDVISLNGLDDSAAPSDVRATLRSGVADGG